MSLAKNLIEFASENRIEKIYESPYTGSFSIGSGTLLSPAEATVTIPHGKSQAHFPILIWSTTGLIWQDSQQRIAEGGTGNNLGVTCYVNSSNLVIYCFNSHANSYTIQYKAALVHRDA